MLNPVHFRNKTISRRVLTDPVHWKRKPPKIGTRDDQIYNNGRIYEVESR